MRIVFSAGEASGDAYAAALIREIRKLDPDVDASGMGSGRLQAESVRLVADSRAFGAISVLESLKVGPRVVAAMGRVKREFRGEPGLFIPIDFGFANIRLARAAKAAGWKVLYFIPPGSWKRDRQGKDLPAITDAVVTPFTWSAELLHAAGANAHWFGHPIKQLHRDVKRPRERTRLAVLPGSRTHELQEHVPLVANTLMGLDRCPEVEFALAPGLDPAAMAARWERLTRGRVPAIFTPGDTLGVLGRARAAVVCSGTATLEAVLARTPMVVVYRMPRVAELEAKLIGFKLPKYISLPNILLDEPVVPERVQTDAVPEKVRADLQAILVEGAARRDQLLAFERLDEVLGPDDAITRTAFLVRRMMSAGG